jgi:hypothetical protein
MTGYWIALRDGIILGAIVSAAVLIPVIGSWAAYGLIGRAG